jgi:nitroreductase
LTPKFIELKNFPAFNENEMLTLSRKFYKYINRRRTIRKFLNKPVPREIIENCIKAAGTAPSGANMQPWQFIVVEKPEIKKRI